jgi:hypothetical protein
MNPKKLALIAAFVISATAQNGSAVSDKERLIGAWHLVSITGPDGKPVSEGIPQGMLMYTRDGHVSVQLMYPEPANVPSNKYVKNGYEASFGSYDVNEAAHVLTHHVQGSVTRSLLAGKDLPRSYRFSASRLVIRSARADEHWSVTWEHY